jgi:hypothetical protein
MASESRQGIIPSQSKRDRVSGPADPASQPRHSYQPAVGGPLRLAAVAVGIAAILTLGGCERTPAAEPRVAKSVLMETLTARATVTPSPSSVSTTTLRPSITTGIAERVMTTTTVLALLPSVTERPALATQEAAYLEVRAIRTAMAPVSPTPTATAMPTPLATSTPLAPPPDPRSLHGLVYGEGDRLWVIGSDGKPALLGSRLYGALSSDGTKMVVDLEDGVWLVYLATGERRNLTQGQGGVVLFPQIWAARPDVVIFGANPEGGFTSYGFLSAVKIDGTGFQMLDDQVGSFDPPALGPDGQTIAYEQLGRPFLYRWGKGSEPIDLSRFSSVDLTGVRMRVPAWSPNGGKLAWLASGELSDGNTMALAVLDLARQEARVIHSYQSWVGEGSPPGLAWSPDGTWLAMTTLDQDPSRYGMWVVRADGSEEHYLGPGWDPIWRPDGAYLAFIRKGNGGASAIRVADSATWTVAELAVPKDGRTLGWIRPREEQ